jgi:hypothetical protein
MSENKELNCNSEICEMHFENIEKRLDKHDVDNEQRREEVQAIKEAMITISGAYERTTEDVKDIKDILNLRDPNDRIWKLFEKVIVFLITAAGIAIGMNIPQ